MHLPHHPIVDALHLHQRGYRAELVDERDEDDQHLRQRHGAVVRTAQDTDHEDRDRPRDQLSGKPCGSRPAER